MYNSQVLYFKAPILQYDKHTCVFSDELITAIETDISDAENALDKPESLKIKADNFFAMSTRDTTTSACACNI